MSNSPKNLTPAPIFREQNHNTDHLSDNISKKATMRIRRLRRKLEHFLENTYFVAFMTLITIYALFADDIRQLIPNKSVDDGFFTMASICLGFFTFEIILSCLAKPGYFLGFFFWLDIISTASLIFDIGWISNLIFGTSGNAGAAGAAKLARAGRASRVGTRAGRIVRVVRLIRLIRIVKLYKAAQTTMAEKVDEDENFFDDEMRDGTFGKSITNAQLRNSATLRESHGSKNDLEIRSSSNDLRKGSYQDSIKADGHSQFRKQSVNEGSRRRGTIELMKRDSGSALQNKVEENNEQRVAQSPGNSTGLPAGANLQEELLRNKTKNFELPQETNVGKKLSDLTTKRVITLVMSVMISIPIFNVDTYMSDFTSSESGLNSVWAINQTGDTLAFSLAKDSYINEHKDIRNRLLVLNVLSDPLYNDINEDSLRDSEKQYYNIQSENGTITYAYSCFDQRDDTHLNAILGIARTIFVTCVLTAAALYFSKDSNDLVLSPIENMLVKVKRIAENPLAAAQIEEEEALLYQKLEKEGKLKDFLKKKNDSNYETTILEKTILKLGALLALGFGEAGSNIIAQNMSKNGDVDPMIPGRKVMAIFGFCDIRQFTDATEVLQEGVMVFVNEIAEIVHNTINSFSGAANKNIGDAFLLVWKFPEDEVECDPNDPSLLKLKETTKVSQLADMSVLSFLKVLAGIYKSKKLEKYRHNEGLNQRIKNYSVKMGFGLHVGWAIEGAIGSEYKIDASYLSPNVNMAARLEAATKQFGVPLLISGALQSLCTEDTKKHLRHIDRVTVKGSIQPIDLYTCDVDPNRLHTDKNEVDFSTKSEIEKKQARVESRLKRDDMREKAFSGKYKVAKKFSSDRDLVTMRKPFTKDFEDKFKAGMESYISGNWSKARDLFETTLKMLHNKEKDGPSNTLLNYMGEYGYRAPHDWKGFRELTEK